MENLDSKYNHDKEKSIRRIIKSSELEGLPPTDEMKQTLRAIVYDETTAEKECQKIVAQYIQKNNKFNFLF